MNTEKIVRLTRDNRDAPYLMIRAGEKIRKALAIRGYAPR
mgnify:CR=1 FL=1